MAERESRLVDARAHVVERMTSCSLCPRRCGVDRLRGEMGFCRAPYPARIFYHGMLYGEEIEISPSYEVFFTGCNLRCDFCYARDWQESPTDTESEPWTAALDGLHAKGASCRSLSLIGGEPTVNLLSVLDLLATDPGYPPAAWNSNMYMDESVVEILDGLVDIYIADLHFARDSCAEQRACVSGYFKEASHRVLEASRRTPVILRHLLVPGHAECCFAPIARWARDNIPNVTFHLLGNYRSPDGETLGPEEFNRALDLARDLSLNLYDDPPTVETAEAGATPPPTSFTRDPPLRRAAEEVIIEPDGRLFIRHMTRDLLEIASTLAPADPAIQARRKLFAREGEADEPKHSG